MRSLNGKIDPVKRNHTLDRRRGYRSPSESDVKCPAFEHTWSYFKDQGYFPDYVATCGDENLTCDYRKVIIPEKFALCHRYNKVDNEGFVLKPSSLDESGQRQDINLYYKLRRLFRDKDAQVKMSLARYVSNYVNLFHNTMVVFKPFTMDPSGRVTRIDKSSTLEIRENNSFISGLYVEGSKGMSSYSIDTNVRFNDSDDDSIIIIFRYDPVTKHYYSLEWNRGGMNPKGLSIKKNICTNPTTMTYTTEILYHDDNFLWSTGGIEHRFYLTISDNAIFAQIHYPRYVPGRWYYSSFHGKWFWTGGYYVYNNYQFTVALNDSRLAKGAYGFGSFSQVATFTRAAGHSIIKTGHETYQKVIKLSPKSDRVGGGKILTDQSLEDIFKAERDAYLRSYSLSRDELTDEIYDIQHSSVTEGVIFEDGTKSTKKTNNRLAIATWEYDKDITYTKNIKVSTHNPQIITDNYVIAKDAYVQFVQVLFSTVWVDDGFDLFVDSHKLYENAVMDTRYEQLFTEEEMYARTDGLIQFVYEVKRDPLLFYHNERHIDTHNKKWRFRGNELGWHKDEGVN